MSDTTGNITVTQMPDGKLLWGWYGGYVLAITHELCDDSEHFAWQDTKHIHARFGPFKLERLFDMFVPGAFYFWVKGFYPTRQHSVLRDPKWAQATQYEVGA